MVILITADIARYREMCRRHGLRYVLIDGEYNTDIEL